MFGLLGIIYSAIIYFFLSCFLIVKCGTINYQQDEIQRFSISFKPDFKNVQKLQSFSKDNEAKERDLKFNFLFDTKQLAFYHKEMPKSKQFSPFVAKFPIGKSFSSVRKVKRPTGPNFLLPRGHWTRQSDNVDYEKAKFNTWNEIQWKQWKKDSFNYMKILSTNSDESFEMILKEKNVIEVVFSDLNSLSVKPPEGLIAVGYFLSWLFKIRLSNWNLLKEIIICNLVIDHESGIYFLKTISRNSKVLCTLKINNCVFPIGTVDHLKEEELKNLKILQLTGSRLKIKEVTDLLWKLPLELNHLSIGEFKFNGDLETGRQLVSGLIRLERLEILHVFYSGDSFLEKIYKYMEINVIEDLIISNKKPKLKITERHDIELEQFVILNRREKESNNKTIMLTNEGILHNKNYIISMAEKKEAITAFDKKDTYNSPFPNHSVTVKEEKKENGEEISFISSTEESIEIIFQDAEYEDSNHKITEINSLKQKKLSWSHLIIHESFLMKNFGNSKFKETEKSFKNLPIHESKMKPQKVKYYCSKNI